MTLKTHSSWLGGGVLLIACTTAGMAAGAQRPSASTQPTAIEDAQADKRAAEAIELMSGSGGLVKHKPFSAEAITETVQRLEDGNRIVRRNVTKEYRDRFGRTRREQTIGLRGTAQDRTRTIVSIHDPIANVEYILDPETRTSSVVESAQPTASAKPGSRATASKVVTEKLGNKIIEGLTCAGTRTTATIAAGEIGNDRPITTVTETWFSPDIDAVVQSTATDPRFGKTSYTLRNVHRGDQPPALFEAPSGYTVRQGHAAAVVNEHP